LSIARAQCVLGGARPTVAQSSSTVLVERARAHGRVELRHGPREHGGVEAEACAMPSSDCAATGGNTGGMNLPIDLASMIA
jgi:hypothetical protein